MAEKRIMILGGGLNQIPLFRAAKELGYQTILCDANANVVCRAYADEFYQMDISNPTEVCEQAKKRAVNGVLSNTEALMLCLSKVQIALGLVGNHPASIEALINKYLFRQLERRAEVFSPSTVRTARYDEAKQQLYNFGSSVILKPEKSSGSRGTYVLEDFSDFTEAIFADCVQWSRSGAALLEDYVDIRNKPAIEAEMFLIDGEIKYLFMFRPIRDTKYGTIPQCYCSDTELCNTDVARIKDVLNKLVKEAGLRWGEYNVELSFTPQNEIFVIEINARQGGEKLPEFVHLYTGIDMNKLLVSTCMNDMQYFNSVHKKPVRINKDVIHFRILTDKEGVLQEIFIDPSLKKYLRKSFYYHSVGDYLSVPSHSMASVGVLDFIFPDHHTRKIAEKELFTLIRPIIV